MNHIYEHPIEVHEQDLDELNHVNNVVYIRWVQEASVAHWRSIASDAIRQQFLWVVLRHEIDYRSPALRGDILLARTWVHNVGGPRSIRKVQLYRKQDNRLLAEASTTWCLVSRQALRPVRINDEIKNMLKPST